MPSNRGPGESFDQDEARTDRNNVLDRISTEVGKKIMFLNEDLPDPRAISSKLQSRQWLQDQMRILYLKDLSDNLIDELSYEGETIIDVDNPGILVDYFSELFSLAILTKFELGSGAIKDAVNRGMRAATNDLLELFVPDDIQDEAIRKVYFYQWESDALKPFAREIKGKDGSEYIVGRRTRLPGIEMVYYYALDSLVPERLLVSQPYDPRRLTRPS